MSSYRELAPRSEPSHSYRHDSENHLAKPLYIQKSFLDDHPRPLSSPPPQSPTDLHPFYKKHSRRPTEQDRRKVSDSAFAFPTSDKFSDPSTFLSGGILSPRHPRTRTRTGPSSRSKWHDNPVPPLRFSGTSSLEDTPPTPNDASSVRGFPVLEFPVVVAAPIAGVETLDALVDGMNGMAGASTGRFFFA
ncbi:hypothetical protein JVU11DRAFT_5336 [Chiua virens]|nr:hypothetical protein JVU11DRAFT_5336 [Chiua virens]